MNRAKLFFDYVYYRFNRSYGRYGYTGVIAVTIIQASTAAILFLFVSRAFFEYYGGSELAGFGTLLLFLYNYFKYSGKYDEFDSRWKGEPKELAERRMQLIFLVFVVGLGIVFYTIFGRL